MSCRPNSLLICVAATFTCSAQSPTFSPLNKVTVWQGGGNALPIWSGGAFLAIDQGAPNPNIGTWPIQNIYVSGAEGNATIPLQLPGAVWTQNRALAHASTGAIVASGDAKDAAGQTYSYLAIFAPGTSQPSVIHTDPFIAAGLAIAPDGTIWAKGADYNPPGAGGMRNYSKNSPHGLLRHFSAAGQPIGSAITQSEFTLKQGFWGRYIAASASVVGWCQYDGLGGGPQPQGGSYFEVNAETGAVAKTPLPPFQDGETVDALAITESGQVLLTKSVRGTNTKLYALDRAQGTWNQVQFPAQGFEGTGYFMLGSNGNQVAFWTTGTKGFTAQLAEVQ